MEVTAPLKWKPTAGNVNLWFRSESTFEDGFEHRPNRAQECQMACRAVVVAQPQAKPELRNMWTRSYYLSNLHINLSRHLSDSYIKTSEEERME